MRTESLNCHEAVTGVQTVAFVENDLDSDLLYCDANVSASGGQLVVGIIEGSRLLQLPGECVSDALAKFAERSRAICDPSQPIPSNAGPMVAWVREREPTDREVVESWPHGYSLRPLHIYMHEPPRWFVTLFNERGGEVWADPYHERGQTRSEAFASAAAWIREQGATR